MAASMCAVGSPTGAMAATVCGDAAAMSTIVANPSATAAAICAMFGTICAALAP